jgi:hypothetical protein
MSSDIDFAAHMQAIATALLGKPNPHLSKGTVLRFGTNGSMSVDLKKGTFHSHEENQGGGVLDLIKREKGLEGAEAFEFMRQSGCDVPDSRRTSNGTNGTHYSSAAKPEVEAKPETEATFDYTDEGGQLLFQVVRKVVRRPDGTLVFTPQGKPEKTFRQRHRDPKTGAWIPNVQGIRIVPYKLPELIKAIAVPKTVFIVEGEKKVDTLREAGLQATCSPMGAGKWRQEFTPHFAGAFVVILPDNDAPGHDHGQQIAAALHGTARSVKLLTLPDLPNKGDVLDWLDAGHNAAELKDLVAKAPAWAPPAENRATEPQPSSDAWPTPKEIKPALLPVPAFDPEALLPPVLRDFVVDEAERMPCSPDFVAAALLSTLGSVVGARCGIRPKAHDPWHVVPNLWGAIVGQPASKKTPAMNAATKPLDRLIGDVKAALRGDLDAFEYDKMVHEAKTKALKEQLNQSAKSSGGDGPEVFVERLREHNKQGPSEPTERRFKTNDPTVEKLGELLRDNPAGLLLQRDELVGLLASWDRDGHEGARQFYLEAWSGTSSFDTDRIGRGSIHIPNLCVTLFGGIQPDKLRSYLEAAEHALANDGALQRFQLLVYPDPRKWEYRDRPPVQGVADKVFEIVKELADFDPLMWGAEPTTTAAKMPAFRFEDAAQRVFIEWLTELHRVRLPATEQQLVLQHLTKYEKLFPALALILHLVACSAAGARGRVSEAAALMAAGWCEYLEAHARRCYGLLADGGAQAAKALADKVTSGKLTDDFNHRTIERKRWSGLTTDKAIEGAIDWLEACGWIRGAEIRPGPNGGQPTRRYQINPALPCTKAESDD